MDQIKVPTWVPGMVRDAVKEWSVERTHNYKDHPRDWAILCRLATDARMEGVWDELRRRQGASADQMRQYFFYAYDAACHPRPVTTGAELIEMAKTFRAAAAYAAKWRAGPVDARLPEKLYEMAIDAERRAGISAADPTVVLEPSGWRPPALVVLQRETQANAARAYVYELSNFTRQHFGRVLMGSIAVTASVALEQEITREQVHDWTR